MRICAAVLCCLGFVAECGWVATQGVAAERSEAESDAALRWDFESMDKSVHGGSIVGDAKIEPVGPSSAEFVGMPRNNPALVLGGDGDYIRIADWDDHRFDFGLGDAITIEAWVRTANIRSGENVYVVGKGRTHLEKTRDNQNYALRLRGVDGAARVSFLFRSAAGDGLPSSWHRWTSRVGFFPDDRWHHIAVTYRFGNSKSVRGYVDGRQVAGAWDMDGATDRGPVVDDDELWIGSSMGGNPKNSLRGAVDQIAIHRRVVPKEEIEQRYVIVERPPPVPDDGGEEPLSPDYVSRRTV